MKSLCFSLGSTDPHWELASQQTRLRCCSDGLWTPWGADQDWGPGSGLEASLPWGTQGQENLGRVGHCGIEAQEKGYKVGRPNTFFEFIQSFQRPAETTGRVYAYFRWALKSQRGHLGSKSRQQTIKKWQKPGLSQIWILSLPPTSSLTMSTWLHFFEPQYSHLQDGIIIELTSKDCCKDLLEIKYREALYLMHGLFYQLLWLIQAELQHPQSGFDRCGLRSQSALC